MDHIVQVHLHCQFRYTDNDLLLFLDRIRARKPTDIELYNIMHDRVLIQSLSTVLDPYVALRQYPHYLVLTMTNAADRQNNVSVMQHTVHNVPPLCTLPMHDDSEYPVYKSMK